MDLQDDAAKEGLIGKILAIEWGMFQSANGSGPKASCQLDKERFGKMRSCQYRVWSVEHLQSWLNDLEIADREARNLAAEKYMRMMEDTHPEEFTAFSDRLPQIDGETRALVNEIVSVHIRWKQGLDSAFPALMNRGRLTASQPSSQGAASFETYLRCELLTCSPRTLSIYKRDIEKMLVEEASEALLNLLNQVKAAGFQSLESANEYYERRTCP